MTNANIIRSFVVSFCDTINLKPGDSVSLDTWKAAKIGSGMDRAGTATGKLVALGKHIRCYGCSHSWREVTISVVD